RTHAGRVFGTARYMFLEQSRGESVSAPSDVFSLGIIFYEMAAGCYPFLADSLFGAIHAINLQPATAPSSRNSNVSAAFDDLILVMLEKDASSRPIAAEVDHWLAGTGAEARFLRARVESSTSGPVSPAPANLLVQRTPFIGRRAELVALLPLLL